MKQKLLCFFVLGFLLISSAYAQDRRITGRVTSAEDGSGIPAVTITAVGSNFSTQSDVNGNYAITVPQSATSLEFRSVGFTTRVVSISGNVLNVTLNVGVEDIEEVVVLGYGAARNISSVVGTVKQISAKEVESRPTANVLDAMQGKVAGVQIYSSSGEPSATPTIRIHGAGSLGASSTPLFVLDGIPMDAGSIVSMNPEDFESITILKDAASTSIYGSRAANGVVYLTSKKGRRNEAPRISIKSQYGVTQLADPSFYTNVFNSEELFDFWLETGFRNQAQIDQLRTNYPHDTKWYEHFYLNNRPMSQTDLSVTGGSERTAYYFSLGHYTSEGLAYRSGFDRYTLRSNVESDINDWMKFGVNLSLGYDIRETNPYGSNQLNRGLALLRQPFYTPYDEDGNLYYDTPIPGLSAYHPKYLADNIQAEGKNTQFNPSAFLQLNPVKGLYFRTQTGLEHFTYRSSSRTMASYNNLFNGSVSESWQAGTTATITTTGEYRFDLGDLHDLSLLVGHEYLRNFSESFNSGSQGQTDDRIMLLGSGPNSRTVGQSKSEYAYNSYFGRASYTYNDKYFVDGTLRQDASSRFGKDNRIANFWSLGAMWRASNEDFLKDVNWLNLLNIRLNSGTSGNSAIGNYESLALIGTNTYDGATGWGISTPGNPVLAWETQLLTTFGIDFRVFNRVTAELSYYDRRTDNMLVDVPYPYTSGFSTITSNVGKLKNSGFDVDISFEVLRGRDYYLTPSLNFTYNKNEVLELFQDNDYWIIPNTGVSWAVGQPVSFFYPVWAGVNPENGDPQWYLPNEDPDQIVVNHQDPTKVTTSFNAGDLQQNTGYRRHAPWAGGFGIASGYKGFELMADFSWVSGKYMINNDRYFFENPNQFAGYNQARTVSDYWKQPGDDALFPRYGVQFTQFDSRLLEDASFLRMKNLTLAYNFPRQWMESTGFVRGARLFVVGRNLLTFTNYSGPDPEVDSNLSLGANPNTKQFTFGAQFQF